MMWAITIVQNESAIPSWLKISSAEIPVTISGTTSGTSIRMFAPGAQRARERDEADRQRGADAVAASIVSSAISSEVNSDSRRVGSLRNSSYHCSEKPSKLVSDLSPLNENRITTKIGTNRNR